MGDEDREIGTCVKANPWPFATKRKPWRTPCVILSKARDTDTVNGIASDGTGSFIS